MHTCRRYIFRITRHVLPVSKEVLYTLDVCRRTGKAKDRYGPWESYSISVEGVCGMDPWEERLIPVPYPEQFRPENCVFSELGLAGVRAGQVFFFLMREMKITGTLKGFR